MALDLGSKWSELTSKFSKYLAVSYLFLTPPKPWNFLFFSYLLGRFASSMGSAEALKSLSTSSCCSYSFFIFLIYSYSSCSFITSLYISELYPFHRSLFAYQLRARSFVTSSAAIFEEVYLAAIFLGLSVHYFLLCPIAPQFSQAPLR